MLITVLHWTCVPKTLYKTNSSCLLMTWNSLLADSYYEVTFSGKWLQGLASTLEVFSAFQQLVCEFLLQYTVKPSFEPGAL